MFKNVEIVENTPKKVVVMATIPRKKLANDRSIFADFNSVKDALMSDHNVRVAGWDCTEQSVLCNYTDTPVLSARFVFEDASSAPTTKTSTKNNLKSKLTNTTSSDTITKKTTVRKSRRRVSSTTKENKLLGTENLE